MLNPQHPERGVNRILASGNAADAFRISSLLKPWHLSLERIERVPSHINNVYRITLATSAQLYLQVSAANSRPSPRHEQHALENEALTLDVLSSLALPVPKVFRHDPVGAAIGAPFLLTSALPGSTINGCFRDMSHTDHQVILGQISSFKTKIRSLKAPAFGPMALVAHGKGYSCWRMAFQAMLEWLLKDGEDAFLNLPYSAIRRASDRAVPSLDDITEARLAICGLGEYKNVLIEDTTKGARISGLLDFKHVVWGDVDFAMRRRGVTTGGRDQKFLLYVENSYPTGQRITPFQC